MIWTTSLEVSRTLKEMGVGLEGEYAWLEDYEIDPEKVTWKLEYNPLPEELELECSYPAFTLDQMYKVLEQVGKVKGWGCGCDNGHQYFGPDEAGGPIWGPCNNCVFEGVYIPAVDFTDHYLRLCEAVPLGKGDEVLREILE